MPRVSVLCLNQALVPPHRREDLAGVSLFNLIIQWFYHFSGISFLYFFCNTGEPQADNSSLATHAFAKAPNDMHVSSHLVSPTVFTVSLTAWSDSMCLIIQPSSLLSLWCLRVVSEASGRQLVKQENLCFLFFLFLVEIGCLSCLLLKRLWWRHRCWVPNAFFKVGSLST